MAVLDILSDQWSNARLYPIDLHGKHRFAFFNIPALPALADIASTVELVHLPPGRVRLLVYACRLTCSAFGAARLLSIGHKAYQNTEVSGAALTALNASAFALSIDVSGALNAAAWGTVLKYDLYSVAGVDIFATIAGGTIPAGATMSGVVNYICE